MQGRLKVLSSAIVVVGAITACTGDPVTPDGSVGGSANTGLPEAGATAMATGGASLGVGGANANGGGNGVATTVAQGGATAIVGTTATGGLPTAGGTTSVVVTTVTGGTASMGGTSSKGGTTSAGGIPSTGGRSSRGGNTSAGGTSSKGSSTPRGGASTTGGVASIGGASSTGGSSNSTSNSTCPEGNSLLCGMVAAHNAARAAVNPAANPALPDMSWDATVAAHAQSWAESCSFSHFIGAGTNEGQNLYASASSGSGASNAPKPQSVVDNWVSEIQYYTYSSNTCVSGQMCGHYTQVVWRNSTLLGCGIKYCSTGSPWTQYPNWWIVVCNYSPAGNYVGKQPY